MPLLGGVKGHKMAEEDDNEKELKAYLRDGVLSESAKKMLSTLTAREAKILRLKFGIDVDDEPNLEALKRQFDVTRQRIREIEEKALRRLRESGPDDDDPGAA